MSKVKGKPNLSAVYLIHQRLGQFDQPCHCACYKQNQAQKEYIYIYILEKIIQYYENNISSSYIYD